MSKTKELYQMSQPVSPAELKAFKDFTNDRNLYPRYDIDDYNQFWADYYKEQEIMEEQEYEFRMNIIREKFDLF